MCVFLNNNNTFTTTRDHKEANHHHDHFHRHSRRHHLEHQKRNPDYSHKAHLIMQLNLSYFTCEKMLLMLLERNRKPGSSSYPFLCMCNSSTRRNSCYSSCSYENKVCTVVALSCMMMGALLLLQFLLRDHDSLNKMVAVLVVENSSSSTSYSSADGATRYECNYDDKMTSLCWQTVIPEETETS